MGLGSSALVSLTEARDLARQYSRIAREGGDPLIARQRDLGRLITVHDAAMKVHEINTPSWKNDKYLVPLEFLPRNDYLISGYPGDQLLTALF